ncbi:diacylglycerol O-acyltransferase 2-like isoform X3 [Chrysemys picta bellii]|uniref:diacylglycerol O-acyltransferase 2-like isoform X3 n=1 Tax=Chrysemys picta bellii TaxID=8478 RepID=UPI000CE6320C|nr:diacylglycerol O-acyltransferase 2-like isoform X3 [Chrysemys picta bellii]
MKTIIAAYFQNRSGSRASIQAALHTLLTVPWPSQREFRACIQLLSVLQWVLSFLLMGGRRSAWVRNWPVWKHFRDYFPIQLVKTHSLLPGHNYIIGAHPHGILCVGAFCNFITESTGFSEKFPGIRPFLATLAGNFRLPVFREYLMSGGLCPVTRQAIGYLLSQNGSGNAVAIVIGGAAESLSCQPGVTTLILKNRKGFVRMALQHGAHLVPAFSFGENDLFRQVVFEEGSWLRGIQKRFQKLVGFAPCVFYGRGLTSIQSRGFLPYPKPITTVIGEPVTVPRIKEPSHETVDLYHAMYIRSLLKLFNDHKAKYGLSEADELRIL